MKRSEKKGGGDLFWIKLEVKSIDRVEKGAGRTSVEDDGVERAATKRRKRRLRDQNVFDHSWRGRRVKCSLVCKGGKRKNEKEMTPDFYTHPDYRGRERRGELLYYHIPTIRGDHKIRSFRYEKSWESIPFLIAY